MQLSRNKRDPELGETAEEYIQMASMSLFFAISEDVYEVTSSAANDGDDNNKPLPTKRFDAAYLGILGEVSATEELPLEVQESQGEVMEGRKGTKGRKRKAKGGEHPEGLGSQASAAKSSDNTNTNTKNVVKNKMAMRLLGLLNFVRAAIRQSEIFQVNKLSNVINGSCGAVSVGMDLSRFIYLQPISSSIPGSEKLMS